MNHVQAKRAHLTNSQHGLTKISVWEFDTFPQVAYVKQAVYPV